MDFHEISFFTSTEVKSEYDDSIENKDVIASYYPINTTWSSYNVSSVDFDFVLNPGNLIDIRRALSG